MELERTAPAVHRSLVLRRLVKLRISMRQRVDVVAALRPGSAGCTTGILVRGAIWFAPRCPAPSELITAPGQFLRVYGPLRTTQVPESHGPINSKPLSYSASSQSRTGMMLWEM